MIERKLRKMSDNIQCLNCSDDDEDSDFGVNNSEIQGTLNKWTNYIHGWQPRFITLKNGTLSYYKSEEDKGYGCRGSISIFKAQIKAHEFDECRFDITLNDCTWYLRADSPDDRRHWIEVLEGYKAESLYGSENSLKRHGSSVSLQSTTLSSASASSFKKSRGLREKLAELDTFQNILCNQMEMLQKYFDKCAEMSTDSLVNGHKDNNIMNVNGTKYSYEINPEYGINAIDFKGEAITFKATTSAVLTTLQHCLDLFSQREEIWKKKVEKEVERRKKVEELYKIARQEMNFEKSKVVIQGGPDLEEGPHSRLKDEEFYDAVETSLDKIEEDEEFRERLKSKQILACQSGNLSTNHCLWPEIERISAEQIKYALQEVGNGSNWHLFAEEGEMKLYKREEMVNGMVMDPLKACHIVRGVTGQEMCHYFFSPDVRMEWETTLDSSTVVEKISENTLIFYQVHKRIWPASQRDAIFWSHKKRVPNVIDAEGQDIWTVTNHSVDLQEFPANAGKTVRIYLTVCLVCQTFVDPPKAGGDKLTRENLRCKITYCSVINPGGWAPAAALRQVYKREYPKFVKRFTAYVVDRCKNKPIMF